VCFSDANRRAKLHAQPRLPGAGMFSNRFLFHLSCPFGARHPSVIHPRWLNRKGTSEAVVSDYFLFRGDKPDGPHTWTRLVQMVKADFASRSEPCMSAAHPDVQTVEDALAKSGADRLSVAGSARCGCEPDDGQSQPRGAYHYGFALWQTWLPQFLRGLSLRCRVAIRRHLYRGRSVLGAGYWTHDFGYWHADHVDMGA